MCEYLYKTYYYFEFNFPNITALVVHAGSALNNVEKAQVCLYNLDLLQTSYSQLWTTYIHVCHISNY